MSLCCTYFLPVPQQVLKRMKTKGVTHRKAKISLSEEGLGQRKVLEKVKTNLKLAVNEQKTTFQNLCADKIMLFDQI